MNPDTSPSGLGSDLGLADSDFVDLHERMTAEPVTGGEEEIDEAYGRFAALLLDLRAVRQVKDCSPTHPDARRPSRRSGRELTPSPPTGVTP
jgi:hypothetical protein